MFLGIFQIIIIITIIREKNAICLQKIFSKIIVFSFLFIYFFLLLIWKLQFFQQIFLEIFFSVNWIHIKVTITLLAVKICFSLNLYFVGTLLKCLWKKKDRLLDHHYHYLSMIIDKIACFSATGNKYCEDCWKASE